MIIPKIQKKILYPQILWQRPVNIYQKRGRIFVLGGEKEQERVIQFLNYLYNCQIQKITLGHPKIFFNIVKSFLPETLSQPLPSTIQNTLDLKSYPEIIKYAPEYDLFILGIGLSENNETKTLIRKIADRDFPIIFYKNGFNVDKNLYQRRKETSLFILNSQEATRWLNEKIDDVVQNPLVTITKLSKTIPKNAIIILQLDKKVFIIKNDSAVLTEVPKNNIMLLIALIAATWSQNIKKPFESAVTACFITKIFLEKFTNADDIMTAINLAEKE